MPAGVSIPLYKLKPLPVLIGVLAPCLVTSQAKWSWVSLNILSILVPYVEVRVMQDTVDKINTWAISI